jgi:hypothetical protein
LKLKIRDLSFKSVGSSQYVEVVVNGHPQPRNLNAPLICGIGKSLGRHLRAFSIYLIYDEYKKHIFPKLLESPEVLPKDKEKIAEHLSEATPYLTYSLQQSSSHSLDFYIKRDWGIKDDQLT